jgi:hypothetical protein
MLLQLQQKSTFIGRKPSGYTEKYYTEWDDGLGKTKISMFLVMSISSTQVPGEEIGKETFQLLQDHFLDDLSGDPYDRFETCLREINLMVSEKEKHYGIKFIPNMHMLCGVIDKDMLFLTQRGESQGYLIRKRHVSSITDGLCDEKNTDEVFQNIASGVLEVNDSVVLTTGKLVQYLAPSDLSKIFSEQSIDEAVNELSDLLKADVDEQMAVISFEVLEKSESVAPLQHTKVRDPEYTKSDVKDSIARAKGMVSKIEFGKPIRVLRDWASRQERLNFLKSIKTWRRDKLLISIAGLVLVLGLGIGILVINGGKQKIQDEMESKLALAEENIDQAETRGTFDKDKASELLTQAEDLSVEVMNSGYFKGKASQLLDRIEEQRDYLDNITRVDDELTLLADFSTAAPGETMKGVVQYGDKVFAYSDNQTFQVLIDQIQTPLALSEGESAVAATYFKDKENILMLSTSGKLLEYDEGNVQFADTADVEWKNGVDIKTYSTRVYILDSLNNQIWRYTRTRDSYGSAQAYVSNTGVDLTKAVSFAVDGNVWILNSDGSITKLLSGEPVTFEIKKAPLTEPTSPTKIYTELELNQVFVLDPTSNKIFVYTKSTKDDNLTYSSQYLIDSVNGKLVDMFYDKNTDTTYLLTETALYKISF